MRYSSIDVLRTVAIMIMVIVHFLENLSGVREWSPDGFGAPLFTFLTGMSYRLWLTGQEARHKESSEISKVSIRRGLFLFGLGFVFNAFIWLPQDLFIWDVLTFIGVSLIVLNVVRQMPLTISVMAVILTFSISPSLQTAADYDSFWTEGHFEYDFSMSDVLSGFLVTGYFPIFPWIAFPITGFVVGSLMFRREEGSPAASSPTEKDTTRLITFRCLIVGLLMAAVSFTCVLVRRSAPNLLPASLFKGWSMYPASIEYVMGTLGMTITVFLLSHRWIDVSNRISPNSLPLRIAGTFSRYSLSIYLLHHAIHIWPLWIYGMAVAQEPTQFWSNAMPWTRSLPLAVLFLFGCYFLLRWVQKSGIPTIESLMRWLCD